MKPSPASFDLIGVGSPIMDLLAPVPDAFLPRVGGAKGGMVLVDHVEMQRILSLLDREPACTTGGSAANTIFNAARLGLRTTFLGKLGGDELARAYRRRFEAAGVDGRRFKHGPQPNARCLALVTPDAQRTMRTCLAAAMTLAPAEISPADFRGCRHAHIEGYLVFNRALADAVLDAARAAGCTVSLDLASFEVVHASRDWLLAQLRRGLDVVFANEDEIRALFQDDASDYAALARRLAGHGVLAAVKIGQDGAWLAQGDTLHRVAPVTVSSVVDTNGAGDAWAAGFLFGHLRGWPLPACGALASLMGAETVRHLGAIIPDRHWSGVKTRALALGPAA
ncbi:MAG: adenosine kinase [Opitutaceae bacterium]|nr:adenosine kinase [Opitutaceae bacterium]